MERTILHSDLNCFYASVEMMLDPSLRGKAVAVCGSTEDRHGIVLAKSEKAKKAGVKTGMVNWEARQLCKDLVIVPPQYDQYLKYSKLTQAIYQRYTDLIEPFGMDECWLDVTGSERIFGDGMTIAEEIRRTVREELGLTVSIGVSYNKIFAKLGSDMKKPDAITEIRRDTYKDMVWPLAADEMIYCGRATKAKLGNYGIRTIGDIAQTNPEFLRRLLGVNGLALWRYANGTDQSRVMHRDFVSPVKSIGHGITCVADLEDDEEVWKVILALSQDIGHRLRVHELSARGVQVSVRGNDLFGSQFQCKLPCKTQLPSEIGAAAHRLFQERYHWGSKVRAVTVRAIDLVPHSDPDQLTMFVDREKYNHPTPPRQMVCSDIRLPFEYPKRVFVRAWNQLVSKKSRYQPILQRTAETTDNALTRLRAKEMIELLDTVGRLADFDYALMLRTLDFIEVFSEDKMSVVFQSGLRITQNQQYQK